MVAAAPTAPLAPRADMGLGLGLGDRVPAFPEGLSVSVPCSSSTSSSLLRKSSRPRASSTAGRNSALDGPIAAAAAAAVATTAAASNGQAEAANTSALTPKQSDVVERMAKVYAHSRNDSGSRGSGGASHLPSVPESSSTAIKRTSRPSGGGRSTPSLRSHTPGPHSLPSSSSTNGIGGGHAASSSPTPAAGPSSSKSPTAPARRSHLRNGSYDIDMDSGLDTALSIVNSPILLASPSNQQTPQQQHYYHHQTFQPMPTTLNASELRIPNSASSRELAMHAKDFVRAISTLANVDDASQPSGSAKTDQEELLKKARALLEIEVRAAQYPANGEDLSSWHDSLARSRTLGMTGSGRRKSNDEWWRGPRGGRRPSATPSEVRPESPLDAHFVGGLNTSASTPEGALGRVALPHVSETSGSRSSGESVTGPLGHARKVSGEEDEQQEVIKEAEDDADDDAEPSVSKSPGTAIDDLDPTRPGEEQHRLALKAGLAWALQQQEAMIKQLEKTAADNKALRERAEDAERAAKKSSMEQSPPSVPKPIDVSLPLSPVPASPMMPSSIPGSPASPTTAQRPQPVRLRSKSLFKALRNSKGPEPPSSFARREMSTSSAPFELSGPSNRLSALSTSSSSQPSVDGHAEISAALNKFAAKSSQSAVATKISKTFGAFLSGAWTEPSSTALISDSQSSLPSVEETDPGALRTSLASARQALAKAEKEKERLQAEVEEVSTQLFSEANELVKQERIETSALEKEVEQLRAAITKRDEKARGKGEGGAAILDGPADEVEQSMMEAVKEAMFSCAKAEEESAAMRDEVKSMQRKVDILEEALFHAVTAVARERSGKQSTSADLSGEGLSAVAMGIYDEAKGVSPSSSKDTQVGKAADETVRQQPDAEVQVEKEEEEIDDDDDADDDEEIGQAVFVGESASRGREVSPRQATEVPEMSRQDTGSSLSLPRRDQSDSAMSFYSADDAAALSQKGDVEDEDSEEEDDSVDEDEDEDEDAKSAGPQTQEDDEVESDTAPTPGPRLSDPAPAVPPPQTVAAITRTLQRASSSSSGGSRGGGSPVVRSSPTHREVRASWASSSPSLSGRARPSSIPEQLPVPRSPLPDIPSPNPRFGNSSPEPTANSNAPPPFVTSPAAPTASEAKVQQNPTRPTQGRRSLPQKPELPQRRGINMASSQSTSSLISLTESQRSESESSQYAEVEFEDNASRAPVLASVGTQISPRTTDTAPSRQQLGPPARIPSSRSQQSLQQQHGAKTYSGLPVISTAGTLDFNAFESGQATFYQGGNSPAAVAIPAFSTPDAASSQPPHGGGSDGGEMRLHRTSTRGSERSHEFLDAASGEWSLHGGSVEGGAPRAPSRQASIRSVTVSETPSLTRQAGLYGSRKKILSGTKAIQGSGLDQLSPDLGAVLRPPPSAQGVIDEAEDNVNTDEAEIGGNSSVKSNKSRKAKKRTVRHPTTFLASSSAASTSSLGHASLLSEVNVASRSSLASRSPSMRSQMASHSSLLSSPPPPTSSLHGNMSIGMNGSSSSLVSPRHSLGASSIKRPSSSAYHHSESPSVYEEARSGAYIRRFAPTVQDTQALPAGRRRNYSEKTQIAAAHPPSLPSSG